MMAEPVSDDSLTAIDDANEKNVASTRLSTNTKLTKILFNDEVQKAIEQVGVKFRQEFNGKPNTSLSKINAVGSTYRCNGQSRFQRNRLHKSFVSYRAIVVDH